METQEIQLISSSDDPNQEVLTGINGDIEITTRIAQAVEQSGRLFPHVVKHVALNRIRTVGSESEEVNSQEIHEYMRSVRDELKLCIDGIRTARQQRLLQAENLTKNIKRDRQPYFVR